MSKTSALNDPYVAATRLWLESFVIDLNLCPFAGRELRDGRINFSVTNATNDIQLLQALESELELLDKNLEIETTLLIHPNVFEKFEDFNQFLDLADGLIEQMQFKGVFQIASFHPDYQFADTHQDDAENYTNRSPYPILHILREESVSRAVEHTADIDEIPNRNIQKMNELGTERLRLLLKR